MHFIDRISNAEYYTKKTQNKHVAFTQTLGKKLIYDNDP